MNNFDFGVKKKAVQCLTLNKITITSKEGEHYDVFAFTGRMFDERGKNVFSELSQGLCFGFTTHSDKTEPPRTTATISNYDNLFSDNKKSHDVLVYRDEHTVVVSFSHQEMCKIKDVAYQLRRFEFFTKEAFALRGNKH